MIGEVLQQAQIVVETAALEHDAKLLQGCRRVPAHVVAENADLAADVVVETGHQGKQCRLAGAVRPQEHDEGATRHGERDIVEGADRPEAMADAAHEQRVHGVPRPALLQSGVIISR